MSRRNSATLSFCFFLILPVLALGQTVTFVDQEGAPTTVYLEGSTAFVRVDDPAANLQPSTVETVNVTLSSVLAGDVEVVLATETGADTGTFEGFIDLLLIWPPATQPGILETTVETWPTVLHDTIQADYNAGAATAGADLLGSRIWLLDAAGAEATSYVLGDRIYLRVEDQNANQPGQVDVSDVLLETALVGDQEWLALAEIDQDSGIFEGSLPLGVDGWGWSWGDGELAAQADDTITASHYHLMLGGPDSQTTATVVAARIEFLDDQGVATTELLEGGMARLRVLSLEDNDWWDEVESLSVDLQSLYAGDAESVELLETGFDTGVFVGDVELATATATAGNGYLETSDSGPPDYFGDQVTATCRSIDATATTVSARVRLVDAFGQERASYVEGETVYVRLVEPNRDDREYVDELFLTLEAPYTPDSETILLTETGFHTGVFAGSVPLGPGYWYSGDGWLSVYMEGEPLTTDHTDLAGVRTYHAEATMVPSTTWFIDAEGQTASDYCESSRVFVRVLDSSLNTAAQDTTSADLVATLSGDGESVTLTETNTISGVFEGSIELALGPAQPYNGVLETSEDPGGDELFDTLTATHQDWQGSSSATADTIGSRTWFVDQYGAETSTFATGATVYLRVEDHNADQPDQVDTVQVTLVTDQDDQEILDLQEVSPNGGIFEGAIEYREWGWDGDGWLQHYYTVSATHDDALGNSFSQATALSLPGSIEFLDDQGAPTVEIPEGGTLRLRVHDLWANYDDLAADYTQVTITTRYADDVETDLRLDETGLNTAVFEGSFPLAHGSGSAENGIIEALTADQVRVTLHWTNVVATARTVPSRVTFLDTFGREATSFALADTVHVRIEDQNRNDPMAVDSFSAEITSLNDREAMAMTETGLDTGVFTGSVLLVSHSSPWYDGVLQVDPLDRLEQIEVRHVNLWSAGPTPARASAVVRDLDLMDAAGQWTDLYLEGSRVFVRVVDVTRNDWPTLPDTLEVILNAELSGDQEEVILTETGNDTSIFVGSMALGLAPGAPWNGVVETTEDPGPPHRFDTVRAIYDPGEVPPLNAAAGLLGSRTWFIDGNGAEVSSYPGGSAVWVRVEDQNANLEGQLDSVQVTVTSSPTGDAEDLLLSEVDPDGGIFEGTLILEQNASATAQDGFLQAQAGDVLLAQHADALGYTVSEAQAELTAAPNSAPSVAIATPADGAEYVEGDPIDFSATATDPEEGDLSANLEWSSDLDGAIGSGGSFSTSTLSVGTHVITASVTDGGGLPASDAISTTVHANTAPTVTISAPADGTTVNVGAEVSFTGTASDPEEGDLTAGISWTSSLDGAIGSGGSFTTSALSTGTHMITASVTDGGGLTDSDEITLTVNSAPVVTVVTPADGATFTFGDSITFSGSAIDAEDGDLGPSLAWTSSLDGAIGTGGSFSTTALSVGTHLVTAAVNDSNGMPGSDAVTVIVRPLPVEVTFTSLGAEDGWIEESSESSDVGGQYDDLDPSSQALRVGDAKKNPQLKALLSFDTSSIPDGATVLSAILRMRRGKLVGNDNPFASFGLCHVDVRTGGFGGDVALAASDFEALATAAQVATMSAPAADLDWSEGSLDAAGLAAVNKTGTTQFRVYFALDDNDDRKADYMGYYGGDDADPANHPQLVLIYQE